MLAYSKNKIKRYVGTTALLFFIQGLQHFILRLSYGIGQGDESYSTLFHFVATANAPLFVGAKPVFADVEEELSVGPRDVIGKDYNSYKSNNTVHYGGCPCRSESSKEIAQDMAWFS